MDMADIDQLQAQAEREAAAVHARLNNVLRSTPKEFRARSRDGRVIVVCDGRAQVVDIALPYGLTGDRVAPWEIQEQLDAVGRGIVDAVNAARRDAAEAGYAQFRQAFPGWFDLLTDLEPESAARPAPAAPSPSIEAVSTFAPREPLAPPTKPAQRAQYLDDADEDEGPPASWLE